MESLLTSDWIPVSHEGRVGHISLEQLLCNEEQWTLSLPRDDMELAALQLLISLVQGVFQPPDDKALRERVSAPMRAEHYHETCFPFTDWFAVEHPEQPFMQSRGVSAKEITPIQKLFTGLPEGNNHAFFNRPGEVEEVCEGCAAIALFNQASNCPSFGGGFKGSLRGGAPVTTFANGKTLRETLWLNVLTKDNANELLPNPDINNTPNWVNTITRNQTVYAHDIGLVRGLFWQPARVELVFMSQAAQCDHCERSVDRIVTGFRKEKFNYTLDGLWPHPHSPRVWDIKKEARDRERFLSFTTTAPAWTQLNYYVIPQTDHNRKVGSVQAPVIEQYHRAFLNQGKLRLLVSGYRNNKASILERRHELFSLPQSWEIVEAWVSRAIDYALKVKKALTSTLYRFHKQVGPKLHESGERLFYASSEAHIRELFMEMDFHEAHEALFRFQHSLTALCRDLLDTETQPYRHDPEGLKVFALCKTRLEGELAKLNAA